MGPAGPRWIERRWIDVQEWMLDGLDRLGERLHPGRTAAHLLTGVRGERAALFALRRRGYVIVATRWMHSRAHGDVDLIAWQGDTLCFVEIKARTARGMTPAASAVDDGKRRALRRLAGLYLHGMPEELRAMTPMRFDVVSLYGTSEIEIVPDAFPFRSPDRHVR